jgi:hypothetical protein
MTVVAALIVESLESLTVALSQFEDHVWFEDWWMVASL